MPPVIPSYDKTLSSICDNLLQRILKWDDLTKESINATDIESLIPEQKIYLLQKLLESEPQPVEKLKKLELLLGLDKVKNAELLFRWLRIGIKAKWEDKIQRALDWITVVGRMKYVRPLYRDLYKWETARDSAIDTYNKNKNKMMHVVAHTVGQDLHLQ